MLTPQVALVLALAPAPSSAAAPDAAARPEPAGSSEPTRPPPEPIAVPAPPDATGPTVHAPSAATSGEPAGPSSDAEPPPASEGAEDGAKPNAEDTISRQARAQDPPILPEFAPDQGAPGTSGVPEDPRGLPPIGTDARIPRVLSTIDGWAANEQAYIRGKKRPIVFVPGAQLRNQVGFVSPFTLDDAGNRYSEGVFSTGRLRWRPQLLLGTKHQVRLVGQVDFASGRWAPQSSDDPVLQQILDEGQPPGRTHLRAVDFRELYVEWRTKVGVLRVGQQAFTWGQGLLSNDGNNMDRFGDLKFGSDGDGSLNERVVFATKPLARSGGPGKDLILAVGADLVYRDAQADLVAGDLAGQGFAVVRWQPEEHPGNWLGAYAVVRGQKNADDGDVYSGDDKLLVGAFDFAGAGWKKLRPNLAIMGAFEAVFIGGRTTFAADPGEQQQVIQLAAALRGYIGNPETWLAGLDAGYMSGDANPYDDEVNNFQAAPGFTAGLLMYQWVYGWQTARSQIRAEDRDLFGEPRNGTQFIPSKGRVTNTVYFQPKARYGFLERAEVWGGPLVAFAPAPVVDPYATTIAGGAPANALGRTGGDRYWGTELDLGVRVRHAYRNLWLQAGVQAGVLFPGTAFADPSGETDGPVWGTWFRTEIRY